MRKHKLERPLRNVFMENVGSYQQLHILLSTDGVQEGATACNVCQLGIWEAT